MTFSKKSMGSNYFRSNTEALSEKNKNTKINSLKNLPQKSDD